MEEKLNYIINKLLTSAWDANKFDIPSLLFKYYKRLKLNEDDLAFVCQLIYFDKCEKNDFPSIIDFSDRMTLSEIEIRKIIQKLLAEGLLKISDKFDKQTVVRSEAYNLTPLYEKIGQVWLEEEGWIDNIDQLLKQISMANIREIPLVDVNAQIQVDATRSYNEDKDIFTIFGEEFGRLLSPMETEKIANWLQVDEHSKELIEEALKQAVYINKFNISYIDKILFEWKKQNIRTPQEAQEANERFQANKERKTNKKTKKENKKDSPPSDLNYWEK